MMQQCIAQYIEKEKLFSLQEKILVTLSGGADSVALLRILLSLGYTCEAAHCNFKLRGKESDKDEQFVKELCHSLQIPLHTTSFDTLDYSAEKHISVEMAARELRYSWFSEIKKQSRCNVIAVAHHQDDSVETMLLNLIRGTGINGLLGIRPKNGDIVRPLLCVDRKRIIAYLNEIEQPFVTDSTNLQDEYTRNKIRLNLIPLMQEINPSIKESLIRTGNNLNEAAKIYCNSIEGGKKRVLTEEGILIKELTKEPSPQALLFEILSPMGFTSAQTENVFKSLTGQAGKQFVSKDWRIIRDRELLLIEKTENIKENEPPVLQFEEKEYVAGFVIPREKQIACFDANKLTQPITLRKWKQGDTFVPFGMKGKKLVSDYLTDRKFSLSMKMHQWVLCSNGEIAWLIGERIDNRFRIDNETKRIIRIKLN
ncbi:tRNA lysidine(34) synthetase TilS [uncultured Bacteroides sp.]|uniref:tRNA lysidine(34) synthetase TilS n=1 Tax=uncultured Bacteroides sp. TaxID=162156 RepID=UPI002AA8AB6F|nr:tRNA lysidine(34) synthetase TilS [uncultured Bacteroides sp.]